MRILSVNIGEFGGLKNISLDFSSSLNLIRGDNESGKSTVLLFIMYMLYGLPKSSKKGTPAAHDKDRSLSIGSKCAEGSMEIECGGRTYRIERSNPRRTASSVATVTELDTGARITLSDEPGEFFLGVDRDTFESCLWCGQTRTAINGDRVAQTLSNLSLTADESVDAGEVLDRIKAARKYYKHERGEGGAISETDEKISKENEKLRDAQKALNDSIEYRAELERLHTELSAAEERVRSAEENRRAMDSLKLLYRFDILRGLRSQIEKELSELDALTERSGFANKEPSTEDLFELKGLERRYDAQRKALDSYNTEPKDDGGYTDGIKVAERIIARESLEEFLSRVKDLEARQKSKKTLALVGAVGFVAFAAAGFAWPLLFAVSALPLALSAITLALSAKEKRELDAELGSIGYKGDDIEEYLRDCFEQRERYLAQKREIEEWRIKKELAQKELSKTVSEIERTLSEYGKNPKDTALALPRLISDISEYLSERKRLENKLALDRQLEARDAAALEGYSEEELVASLPAGIDRSAQPDEISAQRACELARGECRLIEERITAFKIKLAAIAVDSDAVCDIRKNIELLKERRRKYAERYEILSRAYNAVEQAYSNMRHNFAPRIRGRAGELLALVSEGKYSKLFLSEELDVSVESWGREMGAGYLSTGTADAVYIALRFALIEHIFGDGVPFFLDESLSSLDDKRATQALKLISEFVRRGNQCLLFSCHSRETELCRSLGIQANMIEL